MSSEQRKVEPNWSATKVKVALDAALRSSGPVRISVSAGTASGGRAMIHSMSAGGSSTSRNSIPKRAFVAWTSKECSSNVRSVYVTGEVQGRKSPPSSEQAKVTPGWSAVKEKVALVSSVVTGSVGGAAGPCPSRSSR